MKKIKYIITALAFGLAIQGCDVERFPESDIEKTQSIQKVSDGKFWNNGIYSFFRGRVYGVYTVVTDIQADQVNASQDFGNNFGDPHRWDGFVSSNYEIRDVYRGYYVAINNLNTQIEGFLKLNPENDAERVQLNAYLGDAYLARAFYYLNLTLRFAKAYQSSTASTDLAVPLILIPDNEAKPARATVAVLYKQILDDLSKAKANLVDVPGRLGSTRFNVDVATALEARVNLYMGNWNAAKQAAVQLINAGKYPLVTTKAGLSNVWKENNVAEVIFQPAVLRPNELPNLISSYYGFSVGNNDYRPGFLPSKWVVDKYADIDIRKSVYFQKAKVTMATTNVSDSAIVISKFNGTVSNGLNVNMATNYITPKVFRIAEMYLIATEAAFRTAPSNTVDALKYLNELRVARGLPALTGINGNTLFNEIKDERFRELAFEGFRLDDLKRWGEGFERHDPQSLDLVRSGPDYASRKIEANNPKFIWGIPEYDVTINPNIVQNEGW